MTRPTRQQTLMSVGHLMALRGTCDRKQVGAVIAREGRIIAVGYNGAPPGLPHCGDNNHGWDDVIRSRYKDEGRKSWHTSELKADSDHAAQSGCRNATHAEANALAFAARYGVATDEADLFVTMSPCDVCARLLIAAGIGRVYYAERYRDMTGLELLRQGHIPSFLQA